MRQGHRSTLLAWLAIASSVPASRAGEAEVLTLTDAVAQAMTRNDRLAGYRDAEEQAELSERLARNAFRPKVTPNILGSFGRSDVSNQTYAVDLTQRLPTGTELRATVGTATERNQFGDYYNTDTTFSISQPLLRGFGRSAARRQLTSAEVRRAAASRQGAYQRQLVAVDVARAYYQIVTQEELAEVARRSLERSRRLRDASEAKLEAGRVSQLDVFRARQLVTQAEVQLLDAEAAVEDAKDQLRGLMGRDLDYEFEVDRRIPTVAERIAPETAIALALQRRPEVETAEAIAGDAEGAVAYARNQLLPQFDVNLALTRRETVDSFWDSFGLDNFQFATFFAISTPVDRTPQTIQYHTALIERDRARRDVRTVRLMVSSEARRAVRQHERLEKALEAAGASVEFAERELEVAQLRYERGLSNNLDVVNAEGNVLAAQSRRVSLLADLVVARLGLRATLGVLDLRIDLGVEDPTS
jgi:outer membrane protein TolC